MLSPIKFVIQSFFLAGLLVANQIGLPAHAQGKNAVHELPVGADYCAILRAFTNNVDPACPKLTNSFLTRSTGSAATDQFPKTAAPLASAEGDKGYYIRFAFNSVELTAEYKDHLDRLSSVFRSAAMEGVCIKLMGHTDVLGTPEYNRRLSLARARIVQAYLVGQSAIESSRVVSDGAGETNPLLNLPGGHPLNRRVEILARAQTNTGCS
ncbi:OmpA family protein [Roseobacter sp. N2S]|uniref:OmpA family protein n=1 Tax=Roseobacter sp. N2S TaxID=2663844 RepID=UPI0028666EBF|nr:OmpA family protein [Roseobacter sp. N2S]MDR6263027.1 outer membrane protein OmpA-like peptidoglycan-associated protein [Roseobacter sp. N2S]